MKAFSRVVFAVAGSFLGLIVGAVVGLAIGVKIAYDNPDQGGGFAILGLFMVGAAVGAILGLLAGLILPVVADARNERREAVVLPALSQSVSDPDVWPPPPSK